MSSLNPEQAAFLQNICENPSDDTVRLVYADYLDENDEPERAELIRVQVALSRLPPKPRELFVADGAGTRMEGLGVALLRHGDGHYSASTGERGLSTATFLPDERVDIYADLPGKGGPKWVRGLRYVKSLPDREIVVFRKDEESGPWKGTALAARERELIAALGERLSAPCPACGGKGYWKRIGGGGTPGLEPRCTWCGGTGDLLRRFTDDSTHAKEPHPHHFDRGCLLLHVTLGEVCREERKQCPDCKGTRLQRHSLLTETVCRTCETGTIRDWRPTPWAAELPADVVGLWVTDITPDVEFSTVTKRDGWHWKNHRELMFLFPHLMMSELHPTPDHAHIALAHALRLWIYGFQTTSPVTV